jgi:hypothetical protein
MGKESVCTFIRGIHLMEIFIAFSDGSDINELEQTMVAWDRHQEAEVVGLKCPAGKYQTYRRVSAEMMARGDYILADLGCIPVENDFIETAEQYLQKHKKVGMLRADPGHGVDICRKGIVQKWPIKTTQTYSDEHKQAYEIAGYHVETSSKLHYKRLSEAS